jgi:hypothetical protein
MSYTAFLGPLGSSGPNISLETSADIFITKKLDGNADTIDIFFFNLEDSPDLKLFAVPGNIIEVHLRPVHEKSFVGIKAEIIKIEPVRNDFKRGLRILGKNEFRMKLEKTEIDYVRINQSYGQLITEICTKCGIPAFNIDPEINGVILDRIFFDSDNGVSALEKLARKTNRIWYLCDNILIFANNLNIEHGVGAPKLFPTPPYYWTDNNGEANGKTIYGPVQNAVIGQRIGITALNVSYKVTSINYIGTADFDGNIEGTMKVTAHDQNSSSRSVQIDLQTDFDRSLIRDELKYFKNLQIGDIGAEELAGNYQKVKVKYGEDELISGDNIASKSTEIRITGNNEIPGVPILRSFIYPQAGIIYPVYPGIRTVMGFKDGNPEDPFILGHLSKGNSIGGDFLPPGYESGDYRASFPIFAGGTLPVRIGNSDLEFDNSGAVGMKGKSFKLVVGPEGITLSKPKTADRTGDAEINGIIIKIEASAQMQLKSNLQVVLDAPFIRLGQNAVLAAVNATHTHNVTALGAPTGPALGGYSTKVKLE